MLKKSVLVLFVGIFAAALWAEDGATMAPAAKDGAGYVLLDKIVAGFKTMAEKGSGGYEGVNNLLEDAMGEAKAASAQGKIDGHFFSRYRRLLVVAKLAIIDSPYDREGILDEFIVREINSFVDDVTGEQGSLDAKGENKRGIGSVAGAMVEEIINLHVYLDSLKTRPELLKKFGLK
jgi:hypothetical protein